jgi:periplasmic divalent cation tolerance protein
MSSVRLVLTTAPDREAARALARGLVDEGLAACCNLVGGVDSVYRWEGAVREEAEVLLVIKTSAGRLSELERALLARHPYAVPELVVLHPERVEPRYAAWVETAVDAGE